MVFRGRFFRWARSLFHCLTYRPSLELSFFFDEYEFRISKEDREFGVINLFHFNLFFFDAAVRLLLFLSSLGFFCVVYEPAAESLVFGTAFFFEFGFQVQLVFCSAESCFFSVMLCPLIKIRACLYRFLILAVRICRKFFQICQ